MSYDLEGCFVDVDGKYVARFTSPCDAGNVDACFELSDGKYSMDVIPIGDGDCTPDTVCIEKVDGKYVPIYRYDDIDDSDDFEATCCHPSEYIALTLSGVTVCNNACGSYPDNNGTHIIPYRDYQFTSNSDVWNYYTVVGADPGMQVSHVYNRTYEEWGVYIYLWDLVSGLYAIRFFITSHLGYQACTGMTGYHTQACLMDEQFDEGPWSNAITACQTPPLCSGSAVSGYGGTATINWFPYA